jgi:hypothetical protein
MKMTAPAPARTEAEQQVTVNRMYPEYKKVTTSIDAGNCRKFLKNCIVQHRSHVKEAQEKSIIRHISGTVPKNNPFKVQAVV